MPKIFMINGFQVSIWSNENNEPIHVYVSKRKPSKNSPKFWLLSSGCFVPAGNYSSRFTKQELRNILRKLNLNAILVRNFWVSYHGYESYIDKQ